MLCSAIAPGQYAAIFAEFRYARKNFEPMTMAQLLLRLFASPDTKEQEEVKARR